MLEQNKASEQETVTSGDLLRIEDLCVDFISREKQVRAVDHVSFATKAGETFCLVGESGCGKTATALSVARLLPSPPARYSGGRILVGGEDVSHPESARRIRGKTVTYVFQEPAVSLNPVMRVRAQVLEALRLHQPDEATLPAVLSLLQDVKMPDPERNAGQFPFQLSGGMQQRVMLAIALASRPRLLIADEPTTALDAATQAHILALISDLKAKRAMGLLLITHDLGIAATHADRVAVMYAGQIVEQGPAAEVFRAPFHPYTRAIINCIPKLGRSRERRLAAIPGAVPRLDEAFVGCRFAKRCGMAQPSCFSNAPELQEVARDRCVRCPWWSTAPRELPASPAEPSSP